MNKKRQIQRSGTVKQGENIAAHNQAEAEQKPQLAPVAVLTITYAPPLQRVIAIQPAFPLAMSFSDVSEILHAAEKFINRAEAEAERARQSAATEAESK